MFKEYARVGERLWWIESCIVIKYISKIVLEKQKKKYTIDCGQAGVASRIKKLFIFPYLDTGRIH